jgi:hypothetical protein
MQSVRESERFPSLLIGAGDPVRPKVRATSGDPPLGTVPEPPELGLHDSLDVRRSTR